MRNISMFGRVKRYLNYLYFRYNLETHLYMCEPWERTLVNSVFLIILTLTLLISYLYVPLAMGKVKSALPLPQWFGITSIKMQSDDLLM